MNSEFIILADLPREQIRKFESNVVKNAATLTRERTKTSEAFPYLTGELERTEVGDDIIVSSELEYGLSAGVTYAKYVWNMENVHWTNKKTEPKWYLEIYKKHKEDILQTAVVTSLGSVK